MPAKKKAKPAVAPVELCDQERRPLPTVRIGHLSITLLPGESADRVKQLTREVWDQWKPGNVVEEFDCDMIVHARFKIERYQRFREQFVASGIAEGDLDRAILSYRSTLRTAERSLAIAREANPRVPQGQAALHSEILAEMLADMPVKGPVQ